MTRISNNNLLSSGDYIKNKKNKNLYRTAQYNNNLINCNSLITFLILMIYFII